ncbi:MoaD/ThiS family protein [Chloroflexota bacterium]
MSIKINIPSYMRSYSNNKDIFETNGSTVGECLNHLVEQFPGVKKLLFSTNDTLYEHIVISVNGESAYPEQLTKPVKDGDELNIIFLIAGG